jgi:carbonic anhydrase
VKPARRQPALRPLVAALFLAAFAAPLAASDAHAPAAKPAEAAPKAPVGTKPLAHEDPLDRLRERLAEKLGASRAPQASPDVLRVTARPGEATSAAHAAPAPAARKRVAAAAHAAPHATHWDYAGAGGPEQWGKLKPEFASCASGKRQSPIDIREGIRVQLDPVQFEYQPSTFRVLDNGHTIQVNVAPGNSIEVMGRRYELVQFHFHRPSEERIDGRQFDMVAHLVHKDLDGRLAVVAVLLERGSVHPLVQSVWNNLPLEKGDEVPARGTLDLNRLLPQQREYFTYMGSLTTPPCSEGVLWMVMKQPVPISPEQISIFARLYPMNARPIQSAAGRLIKESE